MSRRLGSCGGRKLAVSAGLLVMLAGTAFAEPPAVLDRVPTNVAVVVAARNMQQLSERAQSLMALLDMPQDGDNPFAKVNMALALPGINKTGSVAIVVLPGPDGQLAQDEDSEPAAYMLVPVSDYSALVTILKGNPKDTVATINLDDKDQFVRDIGGGYAIVSPIQELVQGFTDKGGHRKDHANAMGASGRRMADSADLMIFASIPALRAQIEKGAEGMQEQAEMMAAMSGAEGAGPGAAVAAVQSFIKNLARDGQLGFMGLSLGEKGVAMDFGAQFKEGSESASMFVGGGKSGPLLAKLPAQPFYLAMAADLSSPRMKQALSGMAGAGGDEPAGIAGALTNLENADGMSFVMGASPAAMMGGGLFVNTVSYIATKDPAAYLAGMRSTMEKMNGQEVAGAKTTVTYLKDTAEVNGQKVDSWTATMEPDDQDPNAMQMQMMSSMLFGQGGAMGGMAAAVNNGVIFTMSQNTPLMTSALEAAKSGKGLADDALLKETQSNLPANRHFEVYLGVKSLLDAFQGFAAMMVGGAEFTVPPQLAPVGFAGASESGGMNLRLYVPADVMKALSEVRKAMDAGGEDMEAPADGDMGTPEF